MTASVVVTAPIMCVGGVAMAIHQSARLSWLLLVSVPVLVVGNYLIVSRMLPIFRSMQQRIDGINRRCCARSCPGIRVVRAFAREPFEQQRFAAANGRSQCRVDGGKPAGAHAAGHHLDHQPLQRGADLVRRPGIDAGHIQVGSLIAFLSTSCRF